MAGCYVKPVQKADTTGLKTVLNVNGAEIPLNDFLQLYLGNLLRSIAQSLGYPGNSVEVYITRDEVHLYSDQQEVPIRKEFLRTLIESTIRGMLAPLKGIFLLEKVVIWTGE